MSLKTLQEKAGVKPDGSFGPNTFKAAAKYLNITDHASAVHFFAQCAHESGNFSRYTENLNYSWQGLRKVFGKYYKTDEEAKAHHRNPELIANRVYGGRMGNPSNEGYLWRGRGAIQLTGRNNYVKFCNDLDTHEEGAAVMANPDLVASDYAFESAAWFFDDNNIWALCYNDLSEDAVRKVTRKINGGYNGLKHRLELTEKYSKYAL